MKTLYLARSPYKFSWYLILADGNLIPHLRVQFVLKIKPRIRNVDAEPSSYFEHKFYCRSVAMDKPSANCQPHKYVFEELAKCSVGGFLKFCYS